jgi:citrate synthase
VDPPAGGSHAAAFLAMLNGTPPTPVEERVLDAALVLHADHTMNASTFTARVVGSTLADGYAVMAGALGSLSGPLHGGANEAVLHLLDRIGTLEKVAPEVEAMIDRKEKIMGVGHRVYKVKDPRAHVLQALAEELFAEGEPSRYYPMARALEEVVEERLGAKGIHPNVDFYSGIVYDRLGIDRALFTPIFAVSRIAGWSAHWLEQLADNRIFRPRQVYTGETDRTYVPVEER